MCECGAESEDMDWSLRAVYSVLASLLLHISVEAGIGCFKCFSINGSEPACGDPFHPAKGDYYKQFCRQTRTNRVGEFPAKYCTKIMGVNSRTNIEMVVRSCDMENFDNTCGTFIFEGDAYHGCLMSCKTNACNSAVSLVPSSERPWWWWWRWRWRWWDRNVRSFGCVWTVLVVTALLTTPHILWDVLFTVVGSRTAAL